MKTNFRRFIFAAAGLLLLLNGGGCASRRITMADVQNTNDQRMLANAALRNPDWRVRVAAVQKIENDAVLVKVVFTDSKAVAPDGAEVGLKFGEGIGPGKRVWSDPNKIIESEVFDPALFAYERKDGRRPLLTFSDIRWPVSEAALEKLNSPKHLARIAANIPDFEVTSRYFNSGFQANSIFFDSRKPKIIKAVGNIHQGKWMMPKVMDKLNDPNTLVQVVSTAKSALARAAALEKIAALDEASLTEIARNSRHDVRMRQMAVMKLTDLAVVEDMAKYEADLELRQTAKARFQALTR